MTSLHEDEKRRIKSAQKDTDEKKKRVGERRSLFIMIDSLSNYISNSYTKFFNYY